jgi:hypothetical protein
MKVDLILIPTLGRMDKQRTYKNLSPRLKAMTRFVVQAHEAEEMEKRYPGQVIALPSEIRTISPTRQWMWDNFKDRRYMMLDDDLVFTIRDIAGTDSKGEPKYSSKTLYDKDEDKWGELLELVDKCMDDGYHFGGFKFLGAKPSAFPFEENKRLMAAMFVDGPNSDVGINWNRIPAAEDFDASLQWVNKGLKISLITRFMIDNKSYIKGGCDTFRTVQVHNYSMTKLQQLWPEYVKLKTKEIHKSFGKDRWAGEQVLRATILMKKCYEDALKRKKEDVLEQT